MAKKKSKRQEDADSIIGDVLADNMEKRTQQKLVGRSDNEIDPRAIVLKQEENPFAREEEDDEAMTTGTPEEEEEEENPFAERRFDGALTLSGAESYLVREKPDALLLDSWGVLEGVLTNIAGAESGPAIREQLKQFQSRIDVMAVKALADLSGQEVSMADKEAGNEATPAEAVGDGQPAVEPQGHILNDALLAVRSAFDEAMQTPVDEASRLQMMQESVNALGVSIQGNVRGQSVQKSEGFSSADLQQIVAQAVAPLVAEIEALKARAIAGNATSVIPDARAIKLVPRAFNQPAQPVVPQPLPGMTVSTKTDANVTPKLRAIARRSIGIIEQ